MTGAAPGAWRGDPYHRHELRYWDGHAWTPHVSDLGVLDDDPVFPVADGDDRAFLRRNAAAGSQPGPGMRALTDRLGRRMAGVWAVGGFTAVVAIAAVSALGGSSSDTVITLHSAAVPPGPSGAAYRAQGSEPAPRAEADLRASPGPATTAAASTAAGSGAATPAAAKQATRAPASRPGGAMIALATLQVKGRSGGRPAQDAFGPLWYDADQNGCDTRDDVLRRDLDEPRFGPDGCTVQAGTLHDPYTGDTLTPDPGIEFGLEVEIDQVVAIGDAWATGAGGLTAQQRLAFANDPLNLLAVSEGTRAGKRDLDAAGWLPSNGSLRCGYVARQIAVKASYRLWVTPTEKTAMRKILAGCPGQALPTAAQATPPPRVTPQFRSLPPLRRPPAFRTQPPDGPASPPTWPDQGSTVTPSATTSITTPPDPPPAGVPARRPGQPSTPQAS